MKFLNLPHSKKSVLESLNGLERLAEPKSFTVRAFPISRHSFGEFTYHFTVQSGKEDANQGGIARRQRFAKPSYSVKGYRGFESLPLRRRISKVFPAKVFPPKDVFRNRLYSHCTVYCTVEPSDERRKTRRHHVPV